MTNSFISNPYLLENILSMIRTFAPLTSIQTVNKLNTYLPIAEKLSTIIGMYSFLSRVQNYAPITSLEHKSTPEKIISLISNSNIPLNTMLSNPIIGQSIGKMLGNVATGMFSSLSSSLNNNQGNTENFDSNLISLIEQFFNNNSNKN